MNPETFSRLNSDPATPSLTIGSAFGARGETSTPIFSERFGQSYNTASLNKQLSSLRQSGSIEDYITKFNYLASAYDTGESTLMDFFINGLNENLRVHVSIMRDSFLQQHLPVSLDWVQTSATRIAATMQPVMHGQSNFNKHHKKFNNSKPSYGAGFSNHTNRYAKSYNNNRFNKPHFNNRNFHNQGNNRPFSTHSGPETMDLDNIYIGAIFIKEISGIDLLHNT